jgi:[acyl-carrier-protein] S-malonyltransferase
MSRHNNALAFVFPGQGSQSQGMLAELADSFSEIKETFGTASEILGFDLWSLASRGPEEQINLTQNTQPLMLAAGFSAWRIWCRQSAARPCWMAGHSLGEYTALTCAGALAFEDAVRLVAERGRLMQEAVAPGAGAMAAILGLGDEQVAEVCAEAAGNDVVSAVNFNAPGQVVIAGHTEAVKRAAEAAKGKGAKRSVLLPVSVPSHCSLMCPAAEKLEGSLRDITIRTPEIPVVHNVDVASYADPDAIRNALTKQLYSPVRWADSVKFMQEQGVDLFIECGPGKVLSALNRRIVRSCETQPIFDTSSLNKALELAE